MSFSPSNRPSPAVAGRPVDDEIYILLVETMVAERKAAGVRQIDLAAKLGQPQSFISKVENRERRLDVGEYVAWMQALGTDPAARLGQLLASLASRKVDQQS